MRLLMIGAAVAATMTMAAPTFAADTAAKPAAAPTATAPAAAPAKAPEKKAVSKLLSVKVEKTVAVQAGAVWTAVGEFCDIAKWHPSVAKCTASMDKNREARNITTKATGSILEKLGARNAETMTVATVIVRSGLPVTAYRAALSVAPTKDGKGATITWLARFNAAPGIAKDKAIEAVKAYLTPGVDGLAAAAAKVEGQG